MIETLRKIVSSGRTWAGLAMIFAFWPVQLLIPRDDLFDVMDALGLGATIAVVIGYASSVVDVLTRPRRTLKAGDWLLLGVWVVSTATCFRLATLWTWRILDEPVWLVNHVGVAWLIWIIFNGMLLKLYAAGAVDDRPQRRWILIGTAIGVGFLLAAIVIGWVEPLHRRPGF